MSQLLVDGITLTVRTDKRFKNILFVQLRLIKNGQTTIKTANHFFELKLQFHILVFDIKLILLLKEETGERSGNWFAADADRKSFLVLIETKWSSQLTTTIDPKAKSHQISTENK